MPGTGLSSTASREIPYQQYSISSECSKKLIDAAGRTLKRIRNPDEVLISGIKAA
jgi:hypothetical protein